MIVDVLHGQTETGVKIPFGDLFLVDGTMIDTTIESGGVQQLKDGLAQQTTINHGGLQVVGVGGVGALADHTIIEGGTQNVFATADHTTIWRGGTQDVFSLSVFGMMGGGTANNTTIRGGTEIVENGGTAGNTTPPGGLLGLKRGALPTGPIPVEPAKKGT